MIRLAGLTKRFGRRLAVDNVTLHVPDGSIYGLLGHNGAGKSTTLGMILGQVFPTAGDVQVNGHSVATHRSRALSRVGAIFEAPAFYDYLSARANLRIFCQYTAPVDPKRMNDVVELLELGPRLSDKVGTYSHGMRQRLALAQALLPDPKLLILDEPADGLDPEGIAEMRQTIRRLNTEWGMTILFSSHQLHEVEQVCSHIAVMRASQLLYAGPWPPPGGQNIWLRLEVDRMDEAVTVMRQAGMIRHVQGDGRVELLAGIEPAAVNSLLVQRGFRVSALEPHRLTLEEFYLRTANPADQAGSPSHTIDPAGANS
jgi:ABC-2 type transport system ATP-binding protein